VAFGPWYLPGQALPKTVSGWPELGSGHGLGREADMRTQDRLLVDARWTWKPYRVAYEVIKALRGLDTGSVVEVITKDDQGLLNDLGTWCRATGHELAGEQPGQGEARVLIRKAASARNDQTMTVIMSTARLEHAMYPLDKALAVRCSGWA
jgi:TusA-related sulfurtransferase